MVSKALNDPKFFAVVPEFNGLKNRQTELKNAPRKGCGSCKKKQVHHTLFNEFEHIILSMDNGSHLRLKKYLGVESLMLNVLDSKTRQISVRVI